MGIFKRATESIPETRASQSFAFVSGADFEELTCSGYTTLAQNPEVLMACRSIANQVSSMTIHLMANTEQGDKRIINELSRKVDINPWHYMTRRSFMDFTVMNMLLYGNGNAVVFPHTSEGLLQDLEPIAASRVCFMPKGAGYVINIDGKGYDPDGLLHFVLNPNKNEPWRGEGLTAALRDVANNLHQASTTEKGFMESKWKPSLIIKADGMIDEFSSPEGRQKLLDSYIKTNKAGEPWIIPAEQFSVEQVRPLSLGDLAISDMVTLDKRTVASLLGVPAFVVGVGDYNADEWNAFINNTIRPICREIEQELTRKLLTSTKMYWRFNIASLYSYDLKTASDVYSNLYVRGICTGNEVRDKLSMAPLDGLDSLVILENYIPLDKVGEQLKLKQEE